MPRQLDQIAIEEIRHAISGLKGKLLKARVRELASKYDVSEASIYRVTEDARPKRKSRADKGKRRAALLEHEGLKLAAQLVTTQNLDPDLALETARVNGLETPVSLGTFQRYLKEHGVNKAARKNQVRAYRRWEASEPCELFQFDISGVKERWFDTTSRRLVYVSDKDVNANHPNTKPNRVRVWKFTIIDDFSRRRFVRFYAIDKPTSIEVIDFLLHAFRELGVPKTLYTDNDAVIVSKRMKRAAEILDKAFAESGGFKLQQHTPHNAQATGKVERSHQVIEKFEKLIGLKRETPSIEALNEFTRSINNKLDWQEHSVTGVAPMLRWRSTTQALRVPGADVLDAAFKAEEFTRKLNADLTISYAGTPYQLPRKTPFVDWVNRTLTIVWPAGDADWFVVVGCDGIDYEITRVVAGADAAGEFKAVEESTGQRTMKVLKQQAKERKAEEKETGQPLIVPGFDKEFESASEPRPVVMPRPTEALTADKLATITPAIQPSAAPSGRWLGFWAAVAALIDEGVFDREANTFGTDKAWLKGVFADREEMAESEIRAALAVRDAKEEESQDNDRTVLQFKRLA